MKDMNKRVMYMRYVNYGTHYESMFRVPWLLEVVFVPLTYSPLILSSFHLRTIRFHAHPMHNHSHPIHLSLSLLQSFLFNKINDDVNQTSFIARVGGIGGMGGGQGGHNNSQTGGGGGAMRMLFVGSGARVETQRGMGDEFGPMGFLILATPGILFGIFGCAIPFEIMKCVAVCLARWENHEYEAAYDESVTYVGDIGKEAEW